MIKFSIGGITPIILLSIILSFISINIFFYNKFKKKMRFDTLNDNARICLFFLCIIIVPLFKKTIEDAINANRLWDSNASLKTKRAIKILKIRYSKKHFFKRKLFLFLIND